MLKFDKLLDYSCVSGQSRDKCFSYYDWANGLVYSLLCVGLEIVDLNLRDKTTEKRIKLLHFAIV